MASVGTGPATLDIRIYRGDDFDLVLTFVDNADPPAALDMSDGTWRAQIRRRPNYAVASFTVDETDAPTGVLVVSLDKADTELLVHDAYSWDLEQTLTDGYRRTLLAGKVSITADVSRG